VLQEAHMIAETFTTLLILVAVYFGFRLIQAIRLYFKFRGSRLLTCPETNKLVLVEVAAGRMAMEASVDEPYFQVKKCSRWPMCRDCGQDCLRQMETHTPELRFSEAWKAA
jgi:hypothetical protein